MLSAHTILYLVNSSFSFILNWQEAEDSRNKLERPPARWHGSFPFFWLINMRNHSPKTWHTKNIKSMHPIYNVVNSSFSVIWNRLEAEEAKNKLERPPARWWGSLQFILVPQLRNHILKTRHTKNIKCAHPIYISWSPVDYNGTLLTIK